MKKFETPEVEIVKFAVQDIITESMPPLYGNSEGDNCI
jgi:hypothetical protein